MARSEAPNSQSLLELLSARDPRFAKALRKGREIYQIYRISSQNLSPLPLRSFLQETQVSLGEELGLEVAQIDSLREVEIISDVNLVSLVQALSGEGSRVIVIRHGTQFSDVASKIDMMRLPQNMSEPLTNYSMAQAVASGTALAVIANELRRPINVVSSENERALQTAGIIAGIADGILEIDARLNCINYPPREEISEEELFDWLGRENNGTLVWEEAVVDRVCRQPGTYRRISKDMAHLRDQFTQENYDGITILVTHTQQTNAADVLAGDAPSRLREFGMRIFSPHKSILLPSGIFVK